MAGLLRTMRPRQWVKNLLVFLPLLFAIHLVWTPENPATLLPYAAPLAILCAAFCALSSAVYILNDLADRNADRRHPRKRHRPIASGILPVWMAAAAALALAAAGMTGLLLIAAPPLRALALIGVIYLLTNAAYSLRLKHIALVDVMLVAGGYVLRAVAGALAVGAAPSPWLYAVTAAGALFLVIGRRYAEARLASDTLDDRLAGDTSDKRLADDTLDDRLAGDTPDKRFAGDTLDDRFAGDTPDKRRAGDTLDGRPAGDTSDKRRAGNAPASDAPIKPTGQRATLRHYAPPLGGQLLILSAAAALVSYVLYTVEADNLPANHTMLLTVPPVIFGLFRYLYLLNHSADAESPELLAMRDAPLLTAIAIWILTAAAVLALS